MSDDEEFESKLKATQEKLNILLDDAKAGAGGGDLTLIEKVNELHDKLHNVRELLDSADQLQETANDQIDTAGQISVQIEKTILAANNELNVSFFILVRLLRKHMTYCYYCYFLECPRASGDRRRPGIAARKRSFSSI